MSLRCFLNEVLAFESGISPALWGWYEQSLDIPAIRYWAAERPGRIVRAWDTGDPVSELISIREYFRRLGVLHLLNWNDVTSIVKMQCRSMNPWGFVGYQFGEAALIDLGYYLPPLLPLSETGIARFPSYYVGSIPNHSWRHGTRMTLFSRCETGTVLATDVNTWRGSFTGLRGISSFEAFCTPAGQNVIMIDLMRMNLALIRSDLRSFGAILAEHLNSRTTLSGVLAAAHLCGPHAVVRYLLDGSSSADEAGTTLDSYLDRFGGFPLGVEWLPEDA